MIKIHNKIDCCGCESCSQKCPRKCIEMRQDLEGFLYPHIDIDKCNNCGLCEKVCPLRNKIIPTIPSVYAVRNNDEGIRRRSSSGGAFYALANFIISKKTGVVFGVKYNSDFEPIFDSTDNINGLIDFLGSKYIQARVGKAFINCQKYLNEGRSVLFSGTPCQISALRRFLIKDYPNLYTCDFICHGVPSPVVWHNYITGEIEKYKSYIVKNNNCQSKKYSPIITGINFRDKSQGWKHFRFVMSFADNAGNDHNSSNLSFGIHENNYMRAFLKNVILRPSCYACHFRSEKSDADITLADFWGVEHIIPEQDDDKGISLVQTRTYKGECILENASNIWKQKQNIQNKDILQSSFKRSADFDIRRYWIIRSILSTDLESSLKRFSLRLNDKPNFFIVFLNKYFNKLKKYEYINHSLLKLYFKFLN